MVCLMHLVFRGLSQVIRIVKGIIDKYSQKCEKPIKLNKADILTYYDVIHAISWPLFIAARYADTEELRSDIYSLFTHLLELEKKEYIRYYSESKSSPVLLGRIFFDEEEWNLNYSKLLQQRLNEYWSQINNNQDLRALYFCAFKILYVKILDCCRFVVIQKPDGQLYLNQSYIKPYDEYWNTIIDPLLQFGKQYLLRTDKDDSITDVVIEAYVGMIKSLNRQNIPEDTTNELNDITKFFAEEFKWIQKLLTELSLSQKHLKMIRTTWLWHKDYSSNNELKKIGNYK